MTDGASEVSTTRVAISGIAAWLIPGLGHVILGERRRGLVFLVVIAVTFWGGVAIGGVQSTVRPKERRMWFLAQVCTGGHAFAALAWGRVAADQHPNVRAGFAAEDVAVIYTGVAGLLNLLIIFDALATADPSYVRAGARPPPRSQTDT